MKLNKLTKDLENRRQVANLTAAETESLKKIDDLWKRVANPDLPETPKISSESTYRLRDSQLVEAEGLPVFPTTPGISAELADEIILELNKQFQEKVLNNPKHV